MSLDKRAATEEHTRNMNDHARQLYSEGRYHEALTIASMLPDVARMYLGESHPRVADALEILALSQEALGRSAEAEPLFRQVLAIRRTTVGVHHPEYASSLTNLAEILRATARYSEAEPLYQQALDIRRATLGEDDANYAVGIHNLAELYRETGRFAEAEPLYVKARSIWQQTLPSDHPNCIACLNNLAALHLATGRDTSAKEMFQRSHALCRSRFGEGHIQFAVVSANLATLMSRRGEFRESETCYRQAIKAIEASVGRIIPCAPLLSPDLPHCTARATTTEMPSKFARICSAYFGRQGEPLTRNMRPRSVFWLPYIGRLVIVPRQAPCYRKLLIFVKECSGQFIRTWQRAFLTYWPSSSGGTSANLKKQNRFT